jgi:hypothetical protein
VITEPRTAKEIIDQAINDNRAREYHCYRCATIFVLIGVVIIAYGLVTGSWPQTAVGTLVIGMFLLAMRDALEIRRENIAIRLMEVPLSKATTARDAAEVIRDVFSYASIRDILLDYLRKDDSGSQ